jgi:hypothetical protein
MPAEIHIQTQSSSPLLQLSGEALESFRNFYQSMYSEYQHMQKGFGFSVLEGRTKGKK